MSTVVYKKRRLPVLFLDGLRDAGYLLRSPQALYLGLKQKWLVPALLLLTFVLVPAVFLPVTNAVLKSYYPPSTKDKVIGIFKSSHESPLLVQRKEQAALFFWWMVGLGVPIGFIFYAPVIRKASEAENGKTVVSVPLSVEKSKEDGVDRYRLAGEIGSGAMGVVYLAVDKTLEREVALKKLPATLARDPERKERFRREALTLAKLTHPGIVHIYDLVEDDQNMLLVMELVRGGTLERLIADNSPLLPVEACRILDSICETLEHVHQKGIVHRDLKPANILIDEDGKIKVTDFGLARLCQNSDLTLDGSIFGSPNYMSPEQAEGKMADQRSDIYSLGIIAYELLAGVPPFSGEPAAVMAQQVNQQPAPVAERNGDVVPELSELVMAMLEKDPERRMVDTLGIRTRLQKIMR